jgi:hypothetical protein
LKDEMKKKDKRVTLGLGCDKEFTYMTKKRNTSKDEEGGKRPRGTH